MNNSFLVFEAGTLKEELVDTTRFSEREVELVKIIDALQQVQKSPEWSTLKIKVFDGLVDSLTQGITYEARKETPDPLKLNRLAGQLKWAEWYSDLKKLETAFRLELKSVRLQLHGKE